MKVKLQIPSVFCIFSFILSNFVFSFPLQLFFFLFLLLYLFFVGWIEVWDTCIDIVLIILIIIFITIFTFFSFLILFLLVCLLFKGFVWEFLSLEWIIFEFGKPKAETSQFLKFFVYILIILVSLPIFLKFILSPSKLIDDNIGHHFSQEDMPK